MRVIILGGGVIGTSVAYHLARRGANVVIVERSAVGCAASGKSGGFLALEQSQDLSLAPIIGWAVAETPPNTPTTL